MNAVEIKKVMETEKACIKRADTCDRDCGRCELVMDSRVLLEAYNEVIRMVDKRIVCETRKGLYEFDRKAKEI